jgi:hypothetical protein
LRLGGAQAPPSLKVAPPLDRRMVENISRIDASLCAELTHILPYLV